MVDPAELFEAISHPERIKILKILRNQPSSFASLKRQLGIESSGNMDYHLKKLRDLVTVGKDGLYGLTDAGKEALLSVEAIEMWAKLEKRKIKLPIHVIIGSFLCIFSGILLILLEIAFPTTVFTYICGLFMVTGGVLILLRRNTLGAVMSIIFAFFPPPPDFLGYGANHALEIILKNFGETLGPLALPIGVVAGSLPIVGGLMALASTQRIRDLLTRLKKSPWHSKVT